MREREGGKKVGCGLKSVIAVENTNCHTVLYYLKYKKFTIENCESMKSTLLVVEYNEEGRKGENGKV